MKEYNIRFGRNSINKYGLEETDLYITENCKVKDNTIEIDTSEILINEVSFLNAPSNVGVFKIINSFYFRNNLIERIYAIITDITNNRMLLCEVYINGDKLTFYVHDSMSISSLTKFKASDIFYHGFKIYVLYGDIFSGLYNTKYLKFDPLSTGSSVVITDLTNNLPNEIRHPITSSTYNTYYFVSGDGNIVDNSNPHVLFYSVSENPEEFNGKNSNNDYIVVGNNDERIVKLIENSGYLYIFKEKSIWLLSGSGSSNWQLVNITKEFGIFSTTSICIKNGVIYFVDNTFNLRELRGNTINMLYNKLELERIYGFNKIDGVM